MAQPHGRVDDACKRKKAEELILMCLLHRSHFDKSSGLNFRNGGGSMTNRALHTCLARTPSLIHRWLDSGTRYWYADQSGNCVSLQLWAYVSIGRNALAPRLSPLPHSFSLSPSLSGSSLSSQLLLNFCHPSPRSDPSDTALLFLSLHSLPHHVPKQRGP